MGNLIPSAKVNILANHKVWLEDNAIQQLHTTAQLAHIRAAVGLPDLHAGRGYPIGAAFFSTEHFYPALVGGDIGCGMALWQTDLLRHKVSGRKLAKQLGNIDGSLSGDDLQAAADAVQQLLAQHALRHDYASLPLDAHSMTASVGTIGGGNHFAELLQTDTVYDSDTAPDPSRVYLLVHSGSRGLGGAILREHVEQYGHHGLQAASTAASAYLAQHNTALAYAKLNRDWIAKRILAAWKTPARCLLDIHHNHVLPARINGCDGYLHRKGATPSDQGWVMVPGSRGDYSYLLAPTDSSEYLYSLAHGAGRKWARQDCYGRLSGKYTAQDLHQTRFGSTVVCGDKGLLFEEAPAAYKNVDAVVMTLVEAGLCRLIARYKPMLTYKKGDSACC
ncbi:RNA ligase RtcB family protein [Vitreoscilla massiliensis]|uniref:3'-phosphate/5'-hydroxy nucleic acid ligase n=1 Tax=Vitreoscilla massiliensis TaxID=1689272 RepID=A0ABY4E1E3_9NEIS|nr:RNA ligase RtcB family protein [Vitreoscilla massiliensis]UOO89357.1 RNA ligase RtcB family protein [Vitreoscilla massiliensis]